jgi:serine/threonine protein kinase
MIITKEEKEIENAENPTGNSQDSLIFKIFDVKTPYTPTPVFRSLTGKYAVKIIRSSDEEYQQIALREYFLLKKLNHKGIIRVSEAFSHPGKGTIYIVMELVEGLTVKKYVKRES